MLDKESYFDILRTVREYNGTLTYAENRDLINELDHSEFVNILLSWFKLLELYNNNESEMIQYAGIFSKDFLKLDDDIIAWVKLNPNNTRLVIGINFISGYWATGHSATQASIDFLTGLLDSKLDKKSDLYSDLLQTLEIIANPTCPMNVTESKRFDLSKVLLKQCDYLNSNKIHPITTDILEKLVDFHLMTFFALFDSAKSLDTSPFEGISLSKTKAAIVEWLEIYSQNQEYTDEKVWYAGRLLASTGGKGFDIAVSEWFVKSHLLKNVGVTGQFLLGYLFFSKLDQQCYEMLNNAVIALPDNSDGYKAVTSVLATITAD